MEQLLKHVMDNSSSLVIILDPHGKVEYASKSVKQIMGYTREEIIGKDWLSISRRTSAARVEAQNTLSNFIQSKASKIDRHQQLLHTSAGTTRHIVWDTIKSTDGRLAGIGQDVTQQVEAELKLKRLHAKLKCTYTELSDSLEYASRLQRTILKTPEAIKMTFKDAFVFYKPKDQLSGDFYWHECTNTHNFLAVIDCTGHGAPGALISMIANSLLKDIVRRQGVTDPGEILYCLNDQFTKHVNENNQDEAIADGMDLSIVSLRKADNEALFAGANRPAIVVRKELVEQVPGSRAGIGAGERVEPVYETQKLNLATGDKVILFSDGYVDQFGGKRNKKFGRKRLMATLSEAYSMPCSELEQYLEYTLKNWQQDEEQIDDITLAGIEI